MFGIDPLYLALTLPGVILAMWAQAKVANTFGHYSRYRNMQGRSGAQVARAILEDAGIYDVRIERIPGQLTDHYDPRERVLRLSEAVYDSASIAALGVAAHEAGHAIQHYTGYGWLGLRMAIIPLTQFGSQLAFPLFFVGLLMQGAFGGLLVNLGILLFGFAVAFQVITLPVEFNASSRALSLLQHGGYLRQEEVGPAREVLTAAAWTYVAAALTAVMGLLYMILRAQGRRDE